MLHQLMYGKYRQISQSLGGFNRVADLALNPNAGNQYLDLPSVALFPKYHQGQICNLVDLSQLVNTRFLKPSTAGIIERERERSLSGHSFREIILQKLTTHFVMDEKHRMSNHVSNHAFGTIIHQITYHSTSSLEVLNGTDSLLQKKEHQISKCHPSSHHAILAFNYIRPPQKKSQAEEKIRAAPKARLVVVELCMVHIQLRRHGLVGGPMRQAGDLQF